MKVLFSFPRTGSSSLFYKIKEEEGHRYSQTWMEPFTHRIPMTERVQNLDKLIQGNYTLVNTHVRQYNSLLYHHKQQFLEHITSSTLLLRRDINQIVLSWARARLKSFSEVDYDSVTIPTRMVENLSVKLKNELLFCFSKQQRLPENTDLIWYEDQDWSDARYQQNPDKQTSITNYAECLAITQKQLESFENQYIKVEQGIVIKATMSGIDK